MPPSDRQLDSTLQQLIHLQLLVSLGESDGARMLRGLFTAESAALRALADGLVSLVDQDWKTAISHLLGATELSPPLDRVASLALARACTELDLLADALTVLDPLLSREETDTDAWVGCARVLIRDGQHQQAADILGRLLAETPAHAQAHLVLADLLTSTQQLPTAMHHLKAAQRGAPRTAGPYRTLLRIFLTTGRVELAARYARSVLSRPALRHPDILLDMLQLFAAADASGAMRDLLETAEDLLEATPARALRLARFWYELGDIQALDRLADELGSDPQPATAVLRGMAARLEDMPRVASACFERALILDPHIWQAHLHLGSLLIDHDPDRASSHLAHALRLAPTKAEVQLAKTMWELKHGDRTASLSTLRTVAGHQGLRAAIRKQALEVLAMHEPIPVGQAPVTSTPSSQGGSRSIVHS